MTSLANPTWRAPQSIPDGDILLRILGFAPAPAGFYGIDISLPLRIAANDQAALSRLAASMENTNILALQTGGFPLQDALALHSLTRADIEVWLYSLPLGERPPLLILTPLLANALQLGPQSNLAGIPIQVAAEVCPVIPAPWAVTLRLALGQALLWVIPLLIFGWQVLILGETALLAAGFLLGFSGPWINLPPWARGIFSGSLLMLVAGGGLWWFGAVYPALWQLAIFPLAGCWLGILTEGGSA